MGKLPPKDNLADFQIALIISPYDQNVLFCIIIAVLFALRQLSTVIQYHISWSGDKANVKVCYSSITRHPSLGRPFQG